MLQALRSSFERMKGIKRSKAPELVAWQGKYHFKLLAVDVPASSGAEQRLYLEGDSKVYHRGGVINELRDPFLQARPHL